MIDLSFLTLHNLLLWLAGWTIIGILVMGEDKHLATSQEGMRHVERISEKTLHEVALVGGFLGILLGAKAFNHKAKKPSFWGPVAVAVLLWAALFYYVVSGGLLVVNL